MKNENLNDIDKLFQNGIEKEYPYDSNLWNDVLGQLPIAKPAGTKPWVLDALLIVLATASMVYSGFQNHSTASSSTHSTVLYQPRISNSSYNFTEQTENLQTTNTSRVNTNYEKYLSNEPDKADFLKTGSQKSNKGAKKAQPSSAKTRVASGDGNHNRKISPKVDRQQGIAEIEYVQPNPSYLNLNLGTSTKSLRNWISFKSPILKKHSLHFPYKKRRFIYSVQAEYSIGLSSSKSITSGDLEYQLFRQDGEQVTRVQSQSVLAGIHHKHWFGQVGFGQLVINEKLQYAFLEMNQKLSVHEGPLRILNEGYEMDGQVVTLIGRDKDSTFTHDSVTSQHLGTNQITYLTIPIRLGRTFNLNHWNLNLWGGTQVNIPNSFRGTYVNQQLNGTQGESSIEKQKSVVWQVSAGLGIEYRIRSKWYVGGQLSYNTMISSTHEAFNQRYKFLNSGLTIRYDF